MRNRGLKSMDMSAQRPSFQGAANNIPGSIIYPLATPKVCSFLTGVTKPSSDKRQLG